MRIGILGSGQGWHTEALANACRRMGHEPHCVDLTAVESRLNRTDRKLRFEQLDLYSLDRAIVRSIPGGSLEQVIYRIDALHLLLDHGVPVLNPPRAIEACVDKHLAAARLASAGIPTPHTVVCQSARQAREAFAQLGSDVVVKPLFGAEGRGILRVSSPAMADRVFPTLERLACVQLIQQFVTNPGFDVRIFLIEDEPIACMRRWVATGEFRANVTQGGRAEPIVPANEWVDLARRAAKALGAKIAGVDILPTPNEGALVVEVNSSPGFRNLASVSGVDIAGNIVQYAADHLDRHPA